MPYETKINGKQVIKLQDTVSLEKSGHDINVNSFELAYINLYETDAKTSKFSITLTSLSESTFNKMFVIGGEPEWLYYGTFLIILYSLVYFCWHRKECSSEDDWYYEKETPSRQSESESHSNKADSPYRQISIKKEIESML